MTHAQRIKNQMTAIRIDRLSDIHTNVDGENRPAMHKQPSLFVAWDLLLLPKIMSV